MRLRDQNKPQAGLYDITKMYVDYSRLKNSDSTLSLSLTTPIYQSIVLK